MSTPEEQLRRAAEAARKVREAAKATAEQIAREREREQQEAGR